MMRGIDEAGRLCGVCEGGGEELRGRFFLGEVGWGMLWRI